MKRYVEVDTLDSVNELAEQGWRLVFVTRKVKREKVKQGVGSYHYEWRVVADDRLYVLERVKRGDMLPYDTSAVEQGL